MNFYEVITSIKKGETYVSTSPMFYLESIAMDENGILEFEFADTSISPLCIRTEQIFELHVETVPFNEAFVALQEGKTIKSVFSGYEYNKDNIEYYKDEIEDKWIII